MLKIAGIQINCCPDKQKNLDRARLLAAIAAEKGAQMICFQQLLNTHWFPRDIDSAHFQLADEVPGPTVEALQEEARKAQAVMVLPLFEKDGGRYFNTAVVLNADGEMLGRYRKIHVPQIPLWEERAYFLPGDQGFPVFATRFGTIGVQICWDNFFPEGARILALKGAQVIFSPTAAAFDSQARWEKAVCANAAASGVYIFRVNRVGSEPKQKFYGKSFCASPEGELVDQPSGAQEGVVIADVNLQEIERTRRVWNFLADRRPETYGELLKP
jgi:N-carbamoylputrescine amidase